jgi:hypothetical protein
MTFNQKEWKNGSGGGTPVSASSLKDVEKRVTDYADEKTLESLADVEAAEPKGRRFVKRKGDNSGYYEVSDPLVNIEDLGGAASASAATNLAAFNAARAELPGGHGTIYFPDPAGTYVMGGRLNIEQDGITLRGNGHGTKLALAPGANCNLVLVNTTADATGAVRVAGFAMRDLVIDHRGTEQANQGSGQEGAVVVYQTDDVYLDNVIVENARNVGYNLRGNRRLLAVGCKVRKVIKDNASNGFNVGGTNTSEASANTLMGCEVDEAPGVGIWLGSRKSSNVAAIGCRVANGESGVFAEGGSVPGSYIKIIGCHAESITNIGFGVGGESGAESNGRAVINGNTALNCATGILASGPHSAIVGNVLEGITLNGISLEGSGDFEQKGAQIVANDIIMASAATGAGIIANRKGESFTTAASCISIANNMLDGNKAGSYGISIRGRCQVISVIGNQICNWSKSGVRVGANGNASPLEIQIVDNDIRNNNQGKNAVGVNSVGIAIEKSTEKVLIQSNRVTDDQAEKTQTHALLWQSEATRGRIYDNDFSGNSTGGKTVAFDANTIYRGNIDAEAAYQGSVTLVAGEATVETAAVLKDSQLDLGCRKPAGTPGALFVTEKTEGSKFKIKSTSATDTSEVRWTIR